MGDKTYDVSFTLQLQPCSSPQVARDLAIEYIRENLDTLDHLVFVVTDVHNGEETVITP
jgi:hypothetical protein